MLYEKQMKYFKDELENIDPDEDINVRKEDIVKNTSERINFYYREKIIYHTDILKDNEYYNQLISYNNEYSDFEEKNIEILVKMIIGGELDDSDKCKIIKLLLTSDGDEYRNLILHFIKFLGMPFNVINLNLLNLDFIMNLESSLMYKNYTEIYSLFGFIKSDNEDDNKKYLRYLLPKLLENNIINKEIYDIVISKLD